MAKMQCILVTVAALAACTIVQAQNSSITELKGRQAYPMSSLQFAYTNTVAVTNANNPAGSTLSMDVTTDPILATLPKDGLSTKVDNFEPCAIKVPHVHPRANKWSYVAQGTLTVSIVEEDTGRAAEYVVPQGSAIIVPQGLLHTMYNAACNQTLQMLSVFDNRDAGELTMLDKIFTLSLPLIQAATGLDQNTIMNINATLPRSGGGDLRLGQACLAACGGAVATQPSSTAGRR